jgi:uncharacterized glyoxalase superfamily protein PhnB
MTPVLRYRNPGAAARWLCEAFGLREHASAQESDEHVKYILLGLGESCVLVRPVSSSVFDDLMVQPSAVGGGNTHVLYLTIADADAHCTHAKSAGAKIELEPQDDGLGGRFYTCRDPEGHLWSFGTRSYALPDARASHSQRAGASPAPPGLGAPEADGGRRGKRPLRRRSFAAAATLAALTTGWLIYQTYSNGSFEAGGAMTTGSVERNDRGSDPLAPEASRRLSAEGASGDWAAKLNEEQSRRLAAEASSLEAAAKLTDERNRRLAAETAAGEAQAKLGQESTSAAEARQALQAMQGEWSRERRQAQDALALAEGRLSAHVAEAGQAKEEAEKAVAVVQRRLAEHKRASEAAQAELERLRSEAASEHAKEAAAAISASAEAAAVRSELAELSSANAKQGEELEAAYATLQAIRAEIEGLRASQQPPKEATQAEANGRRAAAASEPPPAPAAAAAPPPARPSTPCAQAIQGKVRLSPNGSRVWPEASLARLCHGAETSLEPARCYDELMHGKISWGTGSTWTAAHALILCAGTRNARQTLDCFQTNIAANDTWTSAINACRLAKQ